MATWHWRNFPEEGKQNGGNVAVLITNEIFFFRLVNNSHQRRLRVKWPLHYQSGNNAPSAANGRHCGRPQTPPTPPLISPFSPSASFPFSFSSLFFFLSTRFYSVAVRRNGDVIKTSGNVAAFNHTHVPSISFFLPSFLFRRLSFVSALCVNRPSSHFYERLLNINNFFFHLGTNWPVGNNLLSRCRFQSFFFLHITRIKWKKKIF